MRANPLLHYVVLHIHVDAFLSERVVESTTFHTGQGDSVPGREPNVGLLLTPVVCSFFVTLPRPLPRQRAREPWGVDFFALLALFVFLSFYRLRHCSLYFGVCAENRLYYACSQYRAGITYRHAILIRIVTTTITV